MFMFMCDFYMLLSKDNFKDMDFTQTWIMDMDRNMNTNRDLDMENFNRHFTTKTSKENQIHQGFFQAKG